MHHGRAVEDVPAVLHRETVALYRELAAVSGSFPRLDRPAGLLYISTSETAARRQAELERAKAAGLAALDDDPAIRRVLKEMLEEMLPNAEGKEKDSIVGYKEYHTENTVHFVVELTPEKIQKDMTTDQTFNVISGYKTVDGNQEATFKQVTMKGNGRIVIAAREEEIDLRHASGLPPGKYLCLSVTDNGEGMDPETLARASEPFFTTKGVGKGTGLGLSMVHGMAEQMGGRLLMRSKAGEGTTAEIWLRSASGEGEHA